MKIPDGWGDEQIDRRCCTGAWPEPHVRVTWWNRNYPEVFSNDGRAIGFRWVCGDGSSLKEAREVAASRVRAGTFYYGNDAWGVGRAIKAR